MKEASIAHREREIYKVTLTGSLVNVLLVVCKFIAGVLGHSRCRTLAIRLDNRYHCFSIRAYIRQTRR